MGDGFYLMEMDASIFVTHHYQNSREGAYR